MNKIEISIKRKPKKKKAKRNLELKSTTIEMKNSLFVGNKAALSRHKNQWGLSSMLNTKKKTEEKSRG